MSEQRGKRRWVIRHDDFETEADFRDAVARELSDLENMGHRLGGGFTCAPVRQALEGAQLTEYVTKGWVFEHTFVPAVKKQTPAESVAVIERWLDRPLTEEELAEHFPEQEPVEA